jgi:diguanylate cyclase (GGDEF)-like protein
VVRHDRFSDVVIFVTRRQTGDRTEDHGTSENAAGTGVATSGPMEVTVGTSVAFFLGLVVTAGVLVPLLLRLRGAVSEAHGSSSMAVEQVQTLRRTNASLQEDLNFLTHFLKDYPRLARELYGGLGERQIPAVLLSIVQRSLDPQQIAVLVRREEDKSGKGPRFVVAAAYPEGAAVMTGAELPLDSGEVGFAAEAQIVVSRQDLEEAAAASRIRPGPSLSGLSSPDIIAPLVFDQETLGVVLLARPRKKGDPTAALRLVAQSGAQVLHTAAQVSRMKLTAEMDGLTRVFNKKHMDQSLNELVYRAACAAYDRRGDAARSPAQSLSLFLFDLDHFKNYNDQNGHLAGDKLLQELAALVSRHIRKNDIFGRFGGEEFLVILPNTNAIQAAAAAEKIRNVIASHAFPFGEKQPLKCLSISGGIASYPGDGLDAAGLLRSADEALYEAKRQGRNRVLPAKRPTTTAAAPRQGEAVRP